MFRNDRRAIWRWLPTLSGGSSSALTLAAMSAETEHFTERRTTAWPGERIRRAATLVVGLVALAAGWVLLLWLLASTWAGG